MTLKVEPKTILVIRTNGTEQVFGFETSAKPDLATLIGAKMLDFVSIGRAFGTDLLMAIDDNGYETEVIYHGNGSIELKPTLALKPINAKATRLYHAVCVPGTTHQIAGDVAIFHDGDFT